MELKIGTTIARCRKQRGMTQEQLARAVGVSAPAVSKWETGSSYPDVTLLAPIARALGITTDILLSFQEELSDGEVRALSTELSRSFQNDGFSAGQARCEALLHEYPNSAALKLTIGGLYQTMLGTLPSGEMTEERLHGIFGMAARLYEEVRNSGDPRYFAAATVGLVAFRMSEGKLDEAEELLGSLPKTEVDPNELYPALYQAQGKLEDAERLLESHLFQLVRSAGLALNSLASLSQRREDPERALFFCGLGLRLGELFGQDSSILLEHSALLLMKQGKREEALERLEQYGECLLALPVDYSSHPVFSHLSFSAPPERAASALRMSVKAMEMDPSFEPFREEPRFQALLEKLSAAAQG